jgi:hypothetical protein
MSNEGNKKLRAKTGERRCLLAKNPRKDDTTNDDGGGRPKATDDGGGDKP